jgi:hypothetical protein
MGGENNELEIATNGAKIVGFQAVFGLPALA